MSAAGSFEVAPGVFMAASCHHRKGGRSLSACGPCYARATDALSEIEKHPEKAAEIVARVHAAMQAEAKPLGGATKPARLRGGAR